MVRRIASQVHKTVSRLKEAQLIPEPTWFQSIIHHPPLPVPPRAPPSRTAFDAVLKPAKTDRPRALPVVYQLEDKVRRQFFEDHPFEAFRERTLVEKGTVGDPHPIQGVHWTRLGQHGPNPSAEEVVRFAVNMHVHQNTSLARAYQMAVQQMRALRSEWSIANAFAAREQECTNGHTWGMRNVDQVNAKEETMMQSWKEETAEDEQGQQLARKRWKAVAERATLGTGEEVWSRGRAYTQSMLRR